MRSVYFYLALITLPARGWPSKLVSHFVQPPAEALERLERFVEIRGWDDHQVQDQEVEESVIKVNHFQAKVRRSDDGHGFCVTKIHHVQNVERDKVWYDSWSCLTKFKFSSHRCWSASTSPSQSAMKPT